jgi:hypothetical protein
MDHDLAADASDAPFDALKVITRNALLGALIAFAITVVVCLVSGQKLIDAVAVAAMPALFAGPLVAGTLTVAEHHRYEERRAIH